MGNEESLMQQGQGGGPGGPGTGPGGGMPGAAGMGAPGMNNAPGGGSAGSSFPSANNLMSSMSSSFPIKPGGSGGGPGAMLNNTISQLSSSFPKSIQPMNNLINQFNPGSFPGGQAMSGLINKGHQQQQQQQPTATANHLGPRPPGPTAPAAPTGGAPPDVDLSGLTEEERMIIQSVMAKAQEETSAPGKQLPPAGGQPNKPAILGNNISNNIYKPGMGQQQHPGNIINPNNQQQQPLQSAK